MSDDAEDLATLDAAIARVMHVLEKDNPAPDIREGLERELAVLTELRLEIAKKAGGPFPLAS
jgi:hypothetical protein